MEARTFLAVAALVLVSCSPGSLGEALTTTTSPSEREAEATSTTTSTTTTSTTSTTVAPHQEALEDGWVATQNYLDALAQADYRAMGAVATGPARQYADYLLTVARVDQLFTSTPVEVKVTAKPTEPNVLEEEGQVSLNGEVEVVTGIAEERATFTLTNFVVVRGDDDSWLLESYDRDGIRLATLIQTDGPEVDVNGTLTTLTYAFLSTLAEQTGTFNLAITYTVENRRNNPVSGFSFDTSFVSTSTRRQYEVALAEGAFEVQPGSIADGLLIFGNLDDAQDGGRVVGQFRDRQTFDSWTVELEIPSFTADA